MIAAFLIRLAPSTVASTRKYVQESLILISTIAISKMLGVIPTKSKIFRKMN